MDPLTDREREWLVRDEAVWRRAHLLAAAHPGVDVSDLYHTLKNLDLTPAQRLARGLRHGRLRAQ
jgi:hypothetical protein